MYNLIIEIQEFFYTFKRILNVNFRKISEKRKEKKNRKEVMRVQKTPNNQYFYFRLDWGCDCFLRFFFLKG